MVHSFIGNAVLFSLHTALAKIKLQVNIMVVVAECFQVASPFLSFLFCLEKQSFGLIGCASTDALSDNVLTNQPP